MQVYSSTGPRVVKGAVRSGCQLNFLSEHTKGQKVGPKTGRKLGPNRFFPIFSSLPPPPVQTTSGARVQRRHRLGPSRACFPRPPRRLRRPLPRPSPRPASPASRAPSWAQAPWRPSSRPTRPPRASPAQPPRPRAAMGGRPTPGGQTRCPSRPQQPTGPWLWAVPPLCRQRRPWRRRLWCWLDSKGQWHQRAFLALCSLRGHNHCRSLDGTNLMGRNWCRWPQSRAELHKIGCLMDKA